MAVHPKLSLVGAAILGAVSLGLALFMMGRMTADQPGVLDWVVGLGVGMVVLALVGIGVIRHLPVSRRFEGILHTGGQSSADGFVSATARLDLIGKSGIALSELRPSGMAEIDGERVDVASEGDFVRAGTPVTVVRAEGMRVVVRPAPQLKA